MPKANSKAEKMTPAEAGALGGSVTAPQPKDFLQGNPEAKKLAKRAGTTREEHSTKVSVEWYEKSPDLVIRLSEILLDRMHERGGYMTPRRKAQAAAQACIEELATIEWGQVHQPVRNFVGFCNRQEICQVSNVLLDIWMSNTE